jgi:hypothetical protein
MMTSAAAGAVAQRGRFGVGAGDSREIAAALR